LNLLGLRSVLNLSEPLKSDICCSEVGNSQRCYNHSACLPIAGSIAGVAKCRVVITATVSTSQGGQDRASAASASQGLHKVDPFM